MFQPASFFRMSDLVAVGTFQSETVNFTLLSHVDIPNSFCYLKVSALINCVVLRSFYSVPSIRFVY